MFYSSNYLFWRESLCHSCVLLCFQSNHLQSRFPLGGKNKQTKMKSQNKELEPKPFQINELKTSDFCIVTRCWSIKLPPIVSFPPLLVKASFFFFMISFYKSDFFIFIRNNMLKLLSQQGLNRFLGFFHLPGRYQKRHWAWDHGLLRQE